MLNYFQIFISLFSIMNPILAITIYLDITNGVSKANKKSIAVVCGASIFTILVCFLFLGQPLMNSLGIHSYSLQLAGGIIVLLIGISMILKPDNKIAENKQDENIYKNRRIRTLGISPLALPMVVGPAAIVMVMLYGQQENTVLGKLAIIAVLFTVSVSVVIVFLLANFIAKAIGELGIIVLTKIMGLIIAAIAFEMIVSGLKSVVPILVEAAKLGTT